MADKGRMSGQTMTDRLLAARHSIAGQGLAKSVCKATTEEMIGPKKKHLDYLVHCTNEPNVSIPQMANLLIERSQHANWVVVFKALITVHHMMCYGNERFTQYLASSNCNFQLGNFLDKSGVQGYDMSPFIRRYAKYLNEKALSYRTVAFDFCKVKRGKEAGTLRTMGAEKLLKTVPVLQNQLDALLEFDCTANDLTNGVINMTFMLLFRDLIRLFACYNDGIINLLEKYFDMNKKQCRDALDLYKKFLIRMDRVAEFLKVAEAVGIDKGDIPDLTKAPSSLLDALEQHLATLEGKKGPPTTAASQNSKANITSAVSALSSTSAAFGSAATSSRVDGQQNGVANIDENLKRQALAEEEAMMNQYKEQHAKGQTPTGGPSTNPFLSSPPSSAGGNVLDIFGASTGQAPAQGGKASDDLLQLSGNPFADIFSSGAPAATSVTVTTANSGLWTGMTNGKENGFSATHTSTTNTFVQDSNFSAVFGGGGTAASSGAAATFNPFMSDFGPSSVPAAPTDPSAPSAEASDQNLFGDLGEFGGGKGGGDHASPSHSGMPQMVPPSPSPSPTPAAPPPTPRTGLDDLDASMRAALGGSPIRPQPLQQQAPPPASPQAQPFPQQPNPAAQMAAGQQGVAGGFASPAKHGMGATGFDAFGDILQPTQSSGGSTGTNNVATTAPSQPQPPASKVLTGDLDSSLASLAQNLSMNKGGQQTGKGIQWNSPKNTGKTGGANFNPQAAPAAGGMPFRPMGPGMNMGIGGQFPPMQQMGGMQGFQGMQGVGMRPAGGSPAPPMMGMMRMGTSPQQSQQIPNASVASSSPAMGDAGQKLDPFGAL